MGNLFSVLQTSIFQADETVPCKRAKFFKYTGKVNVVYNITVKYFLLANHSIKMKKMPFRFLDKTNFFKSTAKTRIFLKD